MTTPEESLRLYPPLTREEHEAALRELDRLDALAEDDEEEAPPLSHGAKQVIIDSWYES